MQKDALEKATLHFDLLYHKYPTDLYTSLTRIYRGLPEADYPFADKFFTITNCGRICIRKKKINVRTVFARQNVAITQVEIIFGL